MFLPVSTFHCYVLQLFDEIHFIIFHYNFSNPPFDMEFIINYLIMKKWFHEMKFATFIRLICDINSDDSFVLSVVTYSSYKHIISLIVNIIDICLFPFTPSVLIIFFSALFRLTLSKYWHNMSIKMKKKKCFCFCEGVWNSKI